MTAPFQSGTCLCKELTPEVYYKHPVSPWWGGAKKNRRNEKKEDMKKTEKRDAEKRNSKTEKKQRGGVALQDETPVVTEKQQHGAVLYGGRRRGGRKAQKGGADSLIPTAHSTPADLNNQGPFTDTRADWRQAGTGEGVGMPKYEMTQEQIQANTGLGYKTSGGAKKTSSRKSTRKSTRKTGGGDFDQLAVVDARLKEAETQSGGKKIKKRYTCRSKKCPAEFHYTLHCPMVTAAAAAKKKKSKTTTTKRKASSSSHTKKHRGGGSDFATVLQARGNINAPTQSEAMFRTFNQTAPYMTNHQLMWELPMKSPMFDDSGVKGSNYYDTA